MVSACPHTDTYAGFVYADVFHTTMMVYHDLWYMMATSDHKQQLKSKIFTNS